MSGDELSSSEESDVDMQVIVAEPLDVEDSVLVRTRPVLDGGNTQPVGGTGVLALLLSVDPLLRPSSRNNFRRRASGALLMSCKRNPALCALWNAFIAALI
jgi:hypothetical protein